MGFGTSGVLGLELVAYKGHGASGILGLGLVTYIIWGLGPEGYWCWS